MGSRSAGGLLLSLPPAADARAVSLDAVGSFDRPISIVSEPEDPDRLFVGEREGRVRLLEGGGSSLVADLTSLVLCCESERGLLSIALAPDFAASGLLYVAYTGEEAAGGAEGDIHVDAFRAIDSELALATRRPIIAIDHSSHANHNGGQLQFGPDGYLYVSVGDGAAPAAPGASGGLAAWS